MTIVILQKIGHGLLKAKLCGQPKAKKKEQTVRVGNSVNMFPLSLHDKCSIYSIKGPSTKSIIKGSIFKSFNE